MTDPHAWIATGRALTEAASEGPWEVRASGWSRDRQDEITGPQATVVYPQDEQGGPSWANDADAALIAHARTAYPLALDALEAVLALWPDADPCDYCTHVDCEVVRAITDALTPKEQS